MSANYDCGRRLVYTTHLKILKAILNGRRLEIKGKKQPLSDHRFHNTGFQETLPCLLGLLSIGELSTQAVALFVTQHIKMAANMKIAATQRLASKPFAPARVQRGALQVMHSSQLYMISP